MASRETALHEFDHLGFAPPSDPEREKLHSPKPIPLKSGSPWWSGKLSLIGRAMFAAAASLFAGVGVARVPAVVNFLPAAMLGVVIASCVGGVAISWRLERLLQLPYLSRVAEFQFDGCRIWCSFHGNLRREAGATRYQRIFQMAIGVFAALIALIDTAFTHSRLIGVTSILHWHLTNISLANIEGLVCLLPAVIGLAWYGEWKMERVATRKFKQRVTELATSVSAQLSRTREINGVLAGIDVLCKAMNIEPPNDHHAAIAEFIRCNCAQTVLDATYADPFIEAMTELAKQDLQNLCATLPFHQSLHKMLALARVAVEDCRNPFHEIQLDTIESRISGIVTLLTQRRWAAFQQGCTESMDELQLLHQRARTRKEPCAVLSPGTDPYRLLGIDREMPTLRIKRLRTRLAQIYHPDASGAFPNASRMAEVNAALDAVLAERRER